MMEYMNADLYRCHSEVDEYLLDGYCEDLARN
jgi:hypothetical protein